jgi:hypothetical protein
MLPIYIMLRPYFIQNKCPSYKQLLPPSEDQQRAPQLENLCFNCTRLCLCLPNYLFPSGFLTKHIRCMNQSLPCMLHVPYLIFLHLILLIIICEEKLWSSFCGSFQPSITSSLLGPNILLSTRFVNTLSLWKYQLFGTDRQTLQRCLLPLSSSGSNTPVGCHFHTRRSENMKSFFFPQYERPGCTRIVQPCTCVSAYSPRRIESVLFVLKRLHSSYTAY